MDKLCDDFRSEGRSEIELASSANTGVSLPVNRVVDSSRDSILVGRANRVNGEFQARDWHFSQLESEDEESPWDDESDNDLIELLSSQRVSRRIV